MERVSHSSAILHSNYWCYVAWGRHCIVAASEVGGVWVACTAVSPRSLPLGLFREKGRLRLSNRNSILTGLKTISGEVYGHDERPNTLKLGHVSFLAGQIYKTNNSKQGPMNQNCRLYIQGTKKVIFTACHLGKLKLAYTSPNIISTSPKNFMMSRIDFRVLL